MNIKYILTTLALTGASLSAMAAAEGNYLQVQTTSGWKVIDLDVVDRLSFNNGIMSAIDKNSNTVDSFKQNELLSMFYSETSGTGTVTSGTSQKGFTFLPSMKTVTMNADGNFQIYNVAGEKLLEISSVKDGDTIDLSDMRPGIVILKSGNNSIKVTIK